MPHPVFVVDEDVRILDCNTAAEQLLGSDLALHLYRRSGDELHCIHAQEAPQGCGSAPACRDCIIRKSVREAFSGAKISRRRCPMQLVPETGEATEIQMLITTGPIDFDGRRLVLLVLEDITELLALRKIIPICAGCRKVRNDEQYWQQVEAYFTSRLGVDFSHGICPDCAARLYPELSGELAI
jgi:hypothetical protein